MNEIMGCDHDHSAEGYVYDMPLDKKLNEMEKKIQSATVCSFVKQKPPLYDHSHGF